MKTAQQEIAQALAELRESAREVDDAIAAVREELRSLKSRLDREIASLADGPLDPDA